MSGCPTIEDLQQRVRILEAAVADGGRIEASLRQSEADLAEAQRVSQTGNWTFDVATGLVRWSAELYRVFGVPDQARQNPYEFFLSCVHPEDQAHVQQTNRRTQETGQPFELEYRIVLPSGKLKAIREIGYARRGADGRVVGLFGTAQDITERKRMEGALCESEVKFRALFENTGVGIALGDPRSGLMALVNPAFAAMLGYQPHELAGMPLDVFSHPEDFAVEQTYLQEFVDGKRSGYDMEKRYLRKDGSVFWGRLNVSAVRRADGTIVFGIGVIQDVNERRQAEALLARRSRQLAELASQLTLAEQRVRRQLADDLHDRLQQLLVGARMLTHALAATGDGPGKAGLIDTLARTLGETLETTRGMTLELAPPVAMHRNLTDAVRWLEADMRRLHRLEVDVDIENGLDNVSEAEGVLLFTAARELLLNVVKHAGTLKAGLGLRRLAGSLTLEVCDAGCGFDAAGLSEGGAHGFGIFSIRERAELLGGSFVLETRAGGGVRAALTLPSAARPPEAAPLLACEALPGVEMLPAADLKTSLADGRRIRVLFADDHRIVRESLVCLLATQQDIEVVGESDNGSQAVASVDALRPAVVVMDICMPVMDGVEATRLIKARWPATKVIGLSMYDEVQGGDKMRGAGADDFVCKSAPPAQLVEAIRRCTQG